MNKEYLQSLYLNFTEGPGKLNLSLLNPNFDLDNEILQNNQTIKNRIGKKSLKKNKKDKFSRTEAMLIENLYFFLKKCDKIKYLYQKIIVFKFIKNLLEYEKSDCLPITKREQTKITPNALIESKNEVLKNSLNEESFNKNEELKELVTSNPEENKKPPKEKINQTINIFEKLSDICGKINNQRIIILSAYVKLSNSNKKNSLNYNLNSQREESKNDDDKNNDEGEKDKFMVLKIKEKSEFITQLLKNYEIKNFFNNIIFMESKDRNIISDKELKKLIRVREYFEEIEKELLQIKLNFDNDLNEIDTVELNKQSIKLINKNLGKIYNEQGNLFHFVTKMKIEVIN